MKTRAKRLSSLLLAIIMAMVCLPVAGIAAGEDHVSSDSTSYSDGGLYTGGKALSGGDASDTEVPFESKYAANDRVRILVKTGEPALASKATAEAAISLAEANVLAQEKQVKQIEKAIGAELGEVEHFGMLFNGFSFEGEYGMIAEINKLGGLTAGVAAELTIPDTDTQGEIVNAPYAWDLGYTGKGQVIAIIDTGARLSHEAFSVMPENPRITPSELDWIYDHYANIIHGVSEDYYGSDFYHNEKVPIGISYVEVEVDGIFIHTYNTISNDVMHTRIEEISDLLTDHGTHVAAIAAGNNGNGFKGIAPDAQLAIFKISGINSISEDIALQALEDCLFLGVDVINMSFGMASGYSSDEALGANTYAEALSLLERAGIAVAASAGNSGTFSSSGNYAINTGGAAWADYPDNSTVGIPSSNYWPISVASSDNALKLSASINVGGDTFGFVDRCEDEEHGFLTLEGEYAYVYAGLGRAEDFEGVDASGKLVLVNRGDNSFEDKMQNAYAAGAVGVLVANNTTGTVNMQIENYLIPAVSVTLAAGEALISAMEDGEGVLDIVHGEFIDYSSTGNISSFSSIGSTSDMRIKPELTAPGGNVYSAIGFGNDSSYESWNGTSMASPAVAAGYALLLQALEDRFPDKQRYELKEIATYILLSTASPIEDVLVRAQGAGFMDLAAATTADSYLKVVEYYFEGGLPKTLIKPKVELKDSPDGSWPNATIVVYPLSEPITYQLSYKFYTSLPKAVTLADGSTGYTTDMTVWDITDGVISTFPETFTAIN
ncbi:MAG: S8 family serine peptidase, partial [Clostridia bacterium]|nr:S8 family serine peptidase [Clostridia bacterium]